MQGFLSTVAILGFAGVAFLVAADADDPAPAPLPAVVKAQAQAPPPVTRGGPAGEAEGPPVSFPAATQVEPTELSGIVWSRSTVLGRPNRGALFSGVRLPEEGESFFTWDPPLHVSPNRPWRRWAADSTIRALLRVLDEFRAAHPEGPRLGVGDLSRRNGGPFGRRFGGLGHASHQNGTDVDIYYPRLDRQELAPTKVNQIDRALSQELVNRFVAAGAIYVFVGPRTKLKGPKPTVDDLVHHDDHMHVRFRAGNRWRRLP